MLGIPFFSDSLISTGFVNVVAVVIVVKSSCVASVADFALIKASCCHNSNWTESECQK